MAELLARGEKDLQARLGLAFPPGPPYAGGSSLVVWRYARREETILELVRYLISREVQARYPPLVTHLPARSDVLDEPPYTTDPILSGFARLARGARAFPRIKLGGLLEERFCTAVSRIWQQIAAHPAVDVDALIQQEMDRLARRFRGWSS